MGLEDVVRHLQTEELRAAVLCVPGVHRQRVPTRWLWEAAAYCRRTAAETSDGRCKVRLLAAAAELARDAQAYDVAAAWYAETLDVVEALAGQYLGPTDVRTYCDAAEDYGRGVRILASQGAVVEAALYARRHGRDEEAERLFTEAVAQFVDQQDYGAAAQTCLYAGRVDRARELTSAGFAAGAGPDLAAIVDVMVAVKAVRAAPEAARVQAEAEREFELAAGICWHLQDYAAARAYLALVDCVFENGV